MIEPTETERRQMNERLTRAMDYTAIQPDEYPGWWVLVSPAGKPCTDSDGDLFLHDSKEKAWANPPDFTRDAAASRELVMWLKSQPSGITRHFIAEICHQLWPQDEIFVSSMRIDDLRFFDLLLTDPLLIAQAADAAIGGNNGR